MNIWMIDEPDCSPEVFTSSKKAIARAEEMLNLEDYITETKTTNISIKGCYKLYLIEEINPAETLAGYDLKKIYVHEVQVK
jgi:hypothetical protein